MSRREPLIGDVFAVRGTGLLGRVVSTSAVVGPTHGCVLVYVYAGARLAREALLLPPMMTTRAPWSHGTFEHLRSQPLLPGDYFERHCFRDARGAFVDEEGRPIEAPFEPVGECRILEVGAIEEAVARALAAAGGAARAGGSSVARETAGEDAAYVVEPRPPSVDEYLRLRLEAGLSAKTPDAARAGLAGTWFGVTVRAGGEAVGMGRVVGDGGCFFQVVDVAVLPGHQRRGLGKRIMAALVDHLRAHAPATAHVSLLADGEAHRLYEQFGFRATAPASIGMALKL
ncbi:MAG TPA: GNAT family N-acetyltransferase [Polyangiaceae bacterium]|jgi:ribosomal protein S18 acetylase RimI-like enzyme